MATVLFNVLKGNFIKKVLSCSCSSLGGRTAVSVEASLVLSSAPGLLSSAAGLLSSAAGLPWTGPQTPAVSRPTSEQGLERRTEAKH